MNMIPNLAIRALATLAKISATGAVRLALGTAAGVLLFGAAQSRADVIVFQNGFDNGLTGWTDSGYVQAVSAFPNKLQWDPSNSAQFYGSPGSQYSGTLDTGTLATPVGGTYTVDFYLLSASINGLSGAATYYPTYGPSVGGDFLVKWSGNTIFDALTSTGANIVGTNTSTSNGYTYTYDEYSYSGLSANGGTSDLTFSGYGGSDRNSWFLDSVTVSQQTAATPEPSTFMLFGMASVAFAGYLSVRRKPCKTH